MFHIGPRGRRKVSRGACHRGDLGYGEAGNEGLVVEGDGGGLCEEDVLPPLDLLEVNPRREDLVALEERYEVGL